MKSIAPAAEGEDCVNNRLKEHPDTIKRGRDLGKKKRGRLKRKEGGGESSRVNEKGPAPEI